MKLRSRRPRTIPIVADFQDDPVAIGLISGLAGPGDKSTKAVFHAAQAEAVVVPKKPMEGNLGCCPRALSGHENAAVLSRSAMRSRRVIR